MRDLSFFKTAVETVLCCPSCKSDIHIVNEDVFVCFSCQHKYAIRDGILVFMEDDFQGEQSEEKEMREYFAKQHMDRSPEGILKIISEHHCMPIMMRRAGDFRKAFETSKWIIDIGCGTGYYWRDTNGGNLIVTDFAFSNLKTAKALLKDEDNVIYIHADAANLPIKTASLSGIWSVQVTQHFPDVVMSSFLKEAARILKNEFLIEIYNLNPSLLDKILYRLAGKKLHIKGAMSNMIIVNRLDASELAMVWGDFAKNAKIKCGYSELFFHPDLHLKRQGKSLVFLENVFQSMPILSSLFARQIQIKIHKT